MAKLGISDYRLKVFTLVGALFVFFCSRNMVVLSVLEPYIVRNSDHSNLNRMGPVYVVDDCVLQLVRNDQFSVIQKESKRGYG